VAQLFSLGIVPHFMRISHIIIGAALMAAFGIGCSKSSNERTPTVRFVTYVDTAGNRVVGKGSQAAFEVNNSTGSLVACAFHNPATGPQDMVVTVQPNSTQHVTLYLGKTDPQAMSVTVTQMRTVSSRELSVPMQ
jgi:hypothetical protein